PNKIFSKGQDDAQDAGSPVFRNEDLSCLCVFPIVCRNDRLEELRGQRFIESADLQFRLGWELRNFANATYDLVSRALGQGKDVSQHETAAVLGDENIAGP